MAEQIYQLTKVLEGVMHRDNFGFVSFGTIFPGRITGHYVKEIQEQFMNHAEWLIPVHPNPNPHSST